MKQPISPIEAASFVTAIRAIQQLLVIRAANSNKPGADAYYAVVDSALEVARQILAGTLAPTIALAEALDAALMDETPLPWTMVAVARA